MKKRLFLTGPIGCGKSTVLLKALGPDLFRHAGGFLTVRRRHADGTPADFVLMDPAGKETQVFLDLTDSQPRVDMTVFSGMGVALLNRAVNAPFVVLDEIGGMELQCPEFMAALTRLLRSDVPIIGVLKTSESAFQMEKTIGGNGAFQADSQTLTAALSAYPDTHIQSCVPHTKAALQLAKNWVEEYAHA